MSINLDSEKALPGARKILADKALPWPQVLPGRGYFLPVYRMLGRLPEHPASFPLYVMIAPDGRISYATNSFRRMERFVEVVFDKQRASASRFVPLAESRRTMTVGLPHPVDFSNEAARAIRTDTRITLPPHLPPDARVGRLPNGMLVVARRGATPDTLLLRAAGNGDLDLTDDAEKEFPSWPMRVARGRSSPSVSLRGGRREPARCA